MPQSALVEVQVRTIRQNERADQIESATGTTGFDFKAGVKANLPEDLFEYARFESEVRAFADLSAHADTRLELRLIELREAVRRYF